MGMYLELAPVSDATIARLRADPALAMQIFDPHDPHAADWGDAPPRVFSPAETRAIAEAFAALGEQELGARFVEDAVRRGYGLVVTVG
jgi:hypothetical protein